MNSNIIELRIFGPAGILISCLCLGAFGCKTRSSEGPVANRDEILLCVLADMVTNADSGGDLVRFIEQPTEMVIQLQKRCGPAFSIYPAEDARAKAIHNPYSH